MKFVITVYFLQAILKDGVVSFTDIFDISLTINSILFQNSESFKTFDNRNLVKF